MADDSDILIKAALDITSIDPQIENLKRKFEELSQTSLKFGNFNRSIRTMADNINTAAEAFERFDGAVTGVLGKGALAVGNVGNASLAAAKSAKEAATAVAMQSDATKKLAQAERSVADAQEIRRKVASRPASQGPYFVDGYVPKSVPPVSDRQMQKIEDNLKRKGALEDAYRKVLQQKPASFDPAERARTLTGRAQGPDYFKAYISQLQDPSLFRNSSLDPQSIEYSKRQAELQRTFRPVNLDYQNPDKYGGWDRDTYKDFKDQVNNQGGPTKFMRKNGLSQEQFGSLEGGLNEAGMQLKAVPTTLDNITASVGRVAGRFVEWAAITAVIEESVKTINESVSKAAELQVQGVLFNASQRSAASVGIKTDGASSSQFNEASIALAKRWGDEVNDVAQDLQLWYKRTGDLNTAMILTDNAMELQRATGTDLEDTYRTLTAVTAQAANQPLFSGNKQGISLADAPRMLAMVTSAAESLGGGLLMAGRNGKQLFSDTQEATTILMKGLEQDDAALSKLGLSFEQSLQLTAGLTQAFGNTGAAAEEAGDKVQRIVEGITKLGNPADVKELQKAGFDIPALSKALTPGPNVDIIKNLTDYYEKLKPQQKEVFADMLAGARQANALEAAFKQYENNYPAIIKSTKDLRAEDKLAADMMGTFSAKVDTLKASWEALLIEVGTNSLGPLSAVVDFIRNSVIPAFEDWQHTIQDTAILGTVGAVAGGPVGAIVGGSLGYGIGQIFDHQDQAAAQATAQKQVDSLASELSRPGTSAKRKAQIKQKLGYLATYVPGQTVDTIVPGAEGMLAESYQPGHYEAKPVLTAAQKAARDSDLYKKTQERKMADQRRLDAQFKRQAAQEAQGSPVANPSADTSGQEKDYQALSTTMADANEQFVAMNELQKAQLDTDKGSIDSIQKKISLYGASAELLGQLRGAENGYKSDIDRVTASVNAQIAVNEKFEQAAEKHVIRKKDGSVIPKTKEDAGWVKVYDEAIGKIVSLRNQLSGLATDRVAADEAIEKGAVDLNESIVTKANKAQAEQYTSLDKTFRDSTGTGTQPAYQALISNIFDSYYKTLTRDVGLGKGTKRDEADAEALALFNSRLQDADAALAGFAKTATQIADEFNKSGTKVAWSYKEALDRSAHGGKGDPGALAYDKLQESLGGDNDEYQDRLDKISNMKGGDPDALRAQALAMKDVSDATAQAEYNLTMYQEALKKVEDSAGFVGLSDAFKTLGSTLDSDLINIADGTHAITEALSNLKDQMDRLKDLQSLNNFYFNGMTFKSAMENANQAVSNSFLNQQEQATQVAEAAQQYKQSNPSILNQLEKSFLGGALGSVTSGLESSGLGALASLFTGGQSGGNTQLAATQQNTQALMQLTAQIQKNTNSITGATSVSGAGGGGLSGLASLLGTGGASVTGGLSLLAGLLGDKASGGTNGLLGGLLGGGAAVGGLAAGLGGLGGFGLAGLLSNPIGLGILAAGVLGGGLLGGSIGPHYNETNNPDMFANSGFGQDIANLQGSAYTQATGALTEDPTMQQALGGDTGLQYLDQFYNSHPGGQGLSGSGLQLWQQIGSATGGGQATGLGGLHQGNIDVQNAAGQTLSSGNWQSITTNLNNLTQSLYSFNTALNQSTSQMLTVINQYGGSVGFYPYAGNTPGFNAPNNPPNPSMTNLNPNGLPSNAPSANTGVYGAGASPITAPNVGRSNGEGTINTSINLDGRLLARVTQSYTQQALNAGHQYVS